MHFFILNPHSIFLLSLSDQESKHVSLSLGKSIIYLHNFSPEHPPSFDRSSTRIWRTRNLLVILPLSTMQANLGYVLCDDMSFETDSTTHSSTHRQFPKKYYNFVRRKCTVWEITDPGEYIHHSWDLQTMQNFSGTVGGHLSCSHISSLAYNAAINMEVQIFFKDFVKKSFLDLIGYCMW